jgi:hypothetical protein
MIYAIQNRLLLTKNSSYMLREEAYLYLYPKHIGK